ncbi:MAG: FkbM family methyltransferase [Halobacteriota archaeon]
MELEFFFYDSTAFKRFLSDNPHERGEVEFLELILEEGMNAMDIGGHTGITTVVIAKQIGESGTLYSFEPVPEYFNILNKNIYRNGLKNVKTRQLAVSDHIGTTNFYKNNASSSIVPQAGIPGFQVDTTTIDTFLKEENVERMDLINMDCEGSELFVLKGAEKTLRRNKDKIKIFCEVHHSMLRDLGISVQDLVKYLQELGLQVHSVSLTDLSVGDNFEECDYVYAYS